VKYTSLPFLDSLVSDGIITPVIEEFLFRGMVLFLFGGYFSSPLKLMIFHSSLFWLAHLDQMIIAPQSFFVIMPIFSFGVGYLFTKTRSLFPGLVLHMCFNIFNSL
jgi:membrane protease YdiL (CAAX protease family)